MSSSQYSIIGVQAIVGLIQNLANFNVKSYSTEELVIIDIVNPVTRQNVSVSAVYSLTVLDYSYADLTQYLVVGGLRKGTTKPILYEQYLPEVIFLSVAAGVPVVLISAVTQLNALKVPIIIHGTNPYLYHKSKALPFHFYVSDIDELRNQKSTLLNLFGIPSLTYILWDSFVVHLIYVNDVYQPVFYGRINAEGTALDVKMMMDWCNGVLVGKIEYEVVWLYYQGTFRLTNFLPFLQPENTETSQTQYLISGGSSNFLVQKAGVKQSTNLLSYVWEVSFANQLDYRISDLGPPNQLQSLFIPFTVPLVISDAALVSLVFPNQSTGPMTLEAFLGVNPYLGLIDRVFFQSTQITQIQSTILQNSLPVVFASCCTDLIVVNTTVGVLPLTYYYKITAESFYFYTEDVQHFLEIMTGMISIDDLIKIPFYTDRRVQSSNYYEKPYVENTANKTAPTTFEKKNNTNIKLFNT